MRAGSEIHVVEAEARRAMADPLVREDSALAAQIRDFVAHRVKELRQLKPIDNDEVARAGGPAVKRAAPKLDDHHATEEEVRTSAHRLLEQFENYASHYFEPESKTIAERLAALQREHPKWVRIEYVQHCEATLARLSSRRQEFDNHIDALQRRLVHAAEVGEHDLARKLLQRLSSIHSMHPQVLSDDRFAEIRAEMSRAGKILEHRRSLDELVRRERQVSAEIRSLWHSVHHFHQMARTADHDGEDFRQAEADYRKAVREFQSHDSEWLSAMILELLDVLGDWTHPPPRVEAQLDRFVKSVRESLKHIHREIQQIEREQQGQN